MKRLLLVFRWRGMPTQRLARRYRSHVISPEATK
jgi:hypothetical protein